MMRTFPCSYAPALLGMTLLAKGFNLYDQSVARQSVIDHHEEIPGGTPLRLCPQSHPTDLFQIDSIDITANPVYIEDDFLFHIYGAFTGPIGYNATINATVDCGSHCDIYGVLPGEPTGESDIEDFCEFTKIQQPLGGRKPQDRCLPEPGFALITAPGYAWRMIFEGPGWYNITFDVKTADKRRIFCVTTEVCLRWENPDRNGEYGPYPGSNCSWPY
ncbi:Phosphatidylglycerol/phosphatidylinositol transfer protein [Oleoguttula sp. CCFEE 5521]